MLIVLGEDPHDLPAMSNSVTPFIIVSRASEDIISSD
jgi:hypothetical protein